MKITFEIYYHTRWGESLFLSGDIDELGANEDNRAVMMDYQGDGLWKYTMELPASAKKFHYEYLVKSGGISLARLMELMHDAPCRRFGIGPDTGFTVFDLNAEYPIDPAEFLSMGRATPFAGWRVQGRCLLTSAGETAAWYDHTRLIEGGAL